MSQRIRIALAVAAAVGLLGPGPLADEIVFVTGQRLQGRIEAKDASGAVTFTTRGQRMTIPKDRIKEIVEEADPIDFTILGDQFVELKSYQRAVQMYQRALQASPDHAPAKAGLDRARGLIEAQRNEAQQRQLEENTDLLQQARENIAAGKFEEASRMLEDVESKSPSGEQATAAASLRRSLHLEWGAARLDRLDSIGAEEHLTEALRLDPENDRAKELLLQVWSKNPSKKENVLEAYQERLVEEPANLEYNQKVADLLLGLGREEEAIPSLKRLLSSGKHRALGYDKRLSNAMRNASFNHAAKGDLEGGIAGYSELLRSFPSGDPTPLNYMQYEYQMAKLAEDDYEGRARLVQGLTDQGLGDFAVQEAESILKKDPENSIAMGVIRQDAEGRIAEIEGAMGRGDYYLALATADDFSRDVTRFPDLQARVQDLRTRSQVEIERLAKERREQARAVASRGDEYLAEARHFAQRMSSTETTERTTVLSSKQEAIRNSQRAIDSYEMALQLDPSVGPITGLDVTQKLNDAKRLYSSLTKRPDYRRPMSMRPRLSN